MLHEVESGMRNVLKAAKENKVKRLLVTHCVISVLGNIFKHDKGD
jgi:hypothetical protein